MTNKPLKLSIYDTTDVVFNMQQIKYVLPEGLQKVWGTHLNKIDLEMPIGLTHSWFAGGRLYRWLRWVDESKGCSSWDEGLNWLANHQSDQQIEQIQIWGHGSPGKSWMAGRPIHAGSVVDGPYKDLLQKIADRMTDDGVIWFRNCSVFAGTVGRDFAQSWSDGMSCKIAAHTYIIGGFQSGLHVVSPGQKPDWDPMEGIAQGTPDRIDKIKASMPWSPHTVSMFSTRPE